MVSLFEFLLEYSGSLAYFPVNCVIQNGLLLVMSSKSLQCAES
jgi:hypothetical protein